MPLTLAKLSCGIIYTDSFREWIDQFHDAESPAHPHRVLTLDYVRCASGPQHGRAWWQVNWVPEDAVPKHRIFFIGSAPVHIPKNSQLGLRERCLDFQNGGVVVLP